MEFKLTYDGPLWGASRSDPRARHKHDIRKVFHPQLKRLWEVTPFLKRMRHPLPFALNTTDDTTAYRNRVEYLSEQYKCGNYQLAPLVTEDLGLICGIEIMFLRPDAPGSLIKSGDLDNRLKTLFDALRVPGSLNELGGHEPEPNETPFFCLMQDDKLIHHLSIETGILLQSSRDDEIIDKNDVRLVVTVKLRPTELNWGNIYFSG